MDVRLYHFLANSFAIVALFVATTYFCWEISLMGFAVFLSLIFVLLVLGNRIERHSIYVGQLDDTAKVSFILAIRFNPLFCFKVDGRND